MEPDRIDYPNIEAEKLGNRMVRRALRLGVERQQDQFRSRTSWLAICALFSGMDKDERVLFYEKAHNDIVDALALQGVRAIVYERFDGVSVGGGELPAQSFVCVSTRNGESTRTQMRQPDGAYPTVRIVAGPPPRSE